MTRAFKLWYGVHLDQKEHALRGWNWGKGEFGKAELTFNVQNRPAFEIPYSEIANTNLTGRTEVAVDFSLPTDGEETGTNGHLGGARAKGRKSGGARDQLVEARFYIPGTVLKKEKKEDGEDASGEEEDGEEQNAANTWYEMLVDKAEVGDVAGDTFASFTDILHLTPRSVEIFSLLTLDATILTCAGDDLTSTCTKNPSAYEARHTIIRYNTTPSRSFSSFPSLTISTHSSLLALIHLCVKDKQGIHSLSCSSSEMRTLN